MEMCRKAYTGLQFTGVPPEGCHKSFRAVTMQQETGQVPGILSEFSFRWLEWNRPAT
jgi:hypothetical protein